MLLDIGMVLTTFAAALLPLFLVWLWNWEAPNRHYRPADEPPPEQFHLDTLLSVTLLCGGVIGIMINVHREGPFSPSGSIFCLFAASLLLLLETFEFGAPDSARVKLYRVIQCYPGKKGVVSRESRGK